MAVQGSYNGAYASALPEPSVQLNRVKLGLWCVDEETKDFDPVAARGGIDQIYLFVRFAPEALTDWFIVAVDEEVKIVEPCRSPR